MAKKQRFDLVRSLEGLFARAEEEHDYAACASLARALRDVAPRAAADAHLDPRGLNDSTLVPDMNVEELAELRLHLDAVDALFDRTRVRLGHVVPAPAPIEEPPPPAPIEEPVVEEPDDISPEEFVLDEDGPIEEEP